MVEWLSMMGIGLLETLYMTLVSTLISYIIGLPLGIILVVTRRGHIWPHPNLNRILGSIVNIIRSIPFLILLILVLPLTRLIVGTTIGPTAAIVPLVLSAAPFIGRLVESSIHEI
ncbi:MAG: methionine ABC transporter permease, partial [Christensenellales bacterium]